MGIPLTTNYIILTQLPHMESEFGEFIKELSYLVFLNKIIRQLTNSRVM